MGNYLCFGPRFFKIYQTELVVNYSSPARVEIFEAQTDEENRRLIRRFISAAKNHNYSKDLNKYVSNGPKNIIIWP